MPYSIRLINTDGQVYYWPNISGKPRVSSFPYLYDIVEDNIPDHFPLHKFGFNGAVPATEEDIWEGSNLYSYIPVAESLNISCVNISDTIAGTGARVVKLLGLDGNYNEVDESVNTNGQTGVATINAFIRIPRMIITEAGSHEKNWDTVYAGTGAIVTGVPTNVYNLITTGLNQTLMGLWTVPANHNAFITGLYASTGIANKTTEFELYIRPFGELFQLKQKYHIIAGVITRSFDLPLKVTEKSDIAMRATAVAGGGAISASFDLWYEK